MGNGRSPAGLTMEAVRERGIRGGALPPFHALTVTIPGAAAAWEDVVSLWGKLSLEQAWLRIRDSVRLDFSCFPLPLPCHCRLAGNKLLASRGGRHNVSQQIHRKSIT